MRREFELERLSDARHRHHLTGEAAGGPGRGALDAGRGVGGVGTGEAAISIERRAAAAVVRALAEMPVGPGP